MAANASSPEQILLAAVQRHEAGDLAQAERLYAQVLNKSPAHADALHLLGVLNVQLGRRNDGVALIRQALALRPNWAIAYSNLGNALQLSGDVDGAIAAFRRAILLAPNIPQTHNNLANALAEKSLLDDAIAEYRHALTLKPDYVEALCNLGKALQEQGDLDAAIAAYRRAVAVAPGFSGAYNQLGSALKDAGRIDEALAAYRSAIVCDPMNRLAHSNLIFSLYYHPDFDAVAIAEEHQRWNRAFAEPLRQTHKPHANQPDAGAGGAGRRLRIGYVSPHFWAQAEAHFVAPLFEAHDRGKYEIHAYSIGGRRDGVTERLRRAVSAWHDVRDLDDQQLAEQIRRDAIDILVDLAMHIGDNRLPLFARKPAPVQVTWLAYPGSTGLDTIDYRITDSYMDPPEIPEAGYSEKSVRLPDCWCCYDPMSDLPPAPAEVGDCIHFGSLNNLCKLNDPLLHLWARLLNKVPGSKLILLAPEGNARERVRECMRSAAVDPDRIAFCSPRPRQDYLRLYDQIHIALDPLPYNGITTTLDALWMGVPVVTLAGNTAAGRAGLSLLTTLGLPDLATHTPDEFLAVASGLAGDQPRLRRLRSTLRQRMQQSPLMDAQRFARNLEAAYRRMWVDWCASR